MILLPATSDDWKRRLTDLHTDRAPGDSTQALAERWLAAPAFPQEITRLLSTADATRGSARLVAIPGPQLPLAGPARASRLDLWLLARTRRGLLSVVIDALGEEPFGATGDTPMNDGTDVWAALCRFLEIDQPCDRPIPSQL